MRRRGRRDGSHAPAPRAAPPAAAAPALAPLADQRGTSGWPRDVDVALYRALDRDLDLDLDGAGAPVPRRRRVLPGVEDARRAQGAPAPVDRPTVVRSDVLIQACPLSAADLVALAALEHQVLAADGGRLKLEWGVLRTRSGERAEDLLWWQDGQLVGFAGLYPFGPPSIEVLVMVAPQARRRGIATALLDAAGALCRDRGYSRVLLVVPGGSAAGRQLALARGAVLDHSEHALALTELAAAPPSALAVTLRRAGERDAPLVGQLLVSAFGEGVTAPAHRVADPHEQTWLIELAGQPVGTVRLTRTDEQVGVYGFAVDPRWQGRGIGRAALLQVCAGALRDGAHRVGLEVEVDNEQALGLYTSVGFHLVTTEHYFALSLG